MILKIRLSTIIYYIFELDNLPLSKYFTKINDIIDIGTEILRRTKKKEDIKYLNIEAINEVYHYITNKKYSKAVKELTKIIHNRAYVKFEEDLEKISKCLHKTSLPVNGYDIIHILLEKYQSTAVEELGLDIDDIKDYFVELYSKLEKILEK